MRETRIQRLAALLLVMALIFPNVLGAEETAVPPAPPRYRISGVVWLDEDRDGLRADDEPLMEGAEMRCMVGNRIIQTTMSAADGRYFFEDIPEGEYRVTIIPPIYRHFERYAIVAKGGDSDFSPSKYRSDDFPLNADITLDCGLYVPDAAEETQEPSATPVPDIPTPTPPAPATPSPTINPPGTEFPVPPETKPLETKSPVDSSATLTYSPMGTAPPEPTTNPANAPLRIARVRADNTALTAYTDGQGPIITLNEDQLVIVLGGPAKDCYTVRYGDRRGYLPVNSLDFPSRTHYPADSLRTDVLRKTASEKATPMLRLLRGQRVEVQSVTEKYLYVRVGAQLGYVFTKDFIIKNISSYDAIVIPLAGKYTAPLMTAASGGKTIASYFPGTRVRVTEMGAQVHKVKIGDKTGYMAAEYLRPENP